MPVDDVGERPSRSLIAAVLIAYAIVTFVAAWHHEAWRDEADGWLFARDGSLANLFDYTRHGGTPALWILLLAALAKLGLPYFSQAILHLLIAAAAASVLIVFAPFSRLTKILAVFSYFFSYEYAVIVRSYALSILLIFIAAALFERRREHPIVFSVVVALLFNVNAQGFAIAAALAIASRVNVRGMMIMALGAIAAWLQVRTPADAARHAGLHAPLPQNFVWTVGNAFLPTLHPLIGFVAGMLLLLMMTLALRRSRESLLVLWLPIAAMSLLYVYIWIGGYRHAGFFLVALLVAIWIGASSIEPRYARPAAVLLNVVLAASCLVAIRYWVLDYTRSFSGAQEMAAFIDDRHLSDHEIAAHNLTQCEALLPYLPGKRFWYAGLGEYGTYLTWDAAFERALNVPYPVAELRARQHFAGKRWLLLFNVEMPDSAAHGFRLLYTNQKPIFEKTDERYWLYAPLR